MKVNLLAAAAIAAIACAAPLAAGSAFAQSPLAQTPPDGPRFETVTEIVEVSQPRLVWKTGANLSDVMRADPRTGEIQSLVREPMTPVVITRKVLVVEDQVATPADPASTNSVHEQPGLDGASDAPGAGRATEAPVEAPVEAAPEPSAPMPAAAVLEAAVDAPAEELAGAPVVARLEPAGPVGALPPPVSIDAAPQRVAKAPPEYSVRRRLTW